MTTNDPTLTIVRNQSNVLISAEISAHNERILLERAVLDAIKKLGHNINAVSDASGLTPSEINKLLEAGPTLEDELAALVGATI